MRATVSKYKTEPDGLVNAQLVFILELSIMFAKAIVRNPIGFTIGIEKTANELRSRKESSSAAKSEMKCDRFFK